jgi:hypothetical protein
MRAALLLLAPIALGGIFSLARLTAETFDVPRDEDYAQLTAHLADNARDGDAVVALPAWSLRVHQAAKAHAIISGDDLEWRPLDRWRRLFVVVEPDGEQDHARFQRDTYLEPRETTSLGRLTVYRYDVEPRAVTLDFARQLSEAKVRIDGKNATPCDRPLKGGWGCKGRKGWQRVSLEPLLVSENGDDAIWAHPPPKGETLVLAWEGVRVGDVVSLRAGFTREGADRARAPVKVEVFVDGERVGAAVRRPPEFRFRTDLFKTTPRDAALVEVRVSSRDNGAAHFAFDGYISEARK